MLFAEFWFMRSSPSIAPAPPDDVDIYLVLDNFARLGRAWRETDEESTDRRTLVIDLLDGQYSNPARIVAFNTAEGWSRDVSAEIADEIVDLSGMDGFDVTHRCRNLSHVMRRHGRCNCRCRCGAPAETGGGGWIIFVRYAVRTQANSTG
jgi:hypothetical protein